MNHYIVGYHDAFLIYGEIVREMILEGKNIYDGREFTKRTWNRTYTGLISGNFKINDNGDGEKDFSIHDFDSEGNLHVSIVWSHLLMIITDRSSKRNKYKISPREY